MVNTEVVRDDLHPGAEAPIPCALVEALVGPNKGGLCNFVRLAQIPKFARTRPTNGRVMATEQFTERVVVASLGRENQDGVVFDVVW